MPKCVGILTSGGDSPGLNAAIRAIGRTLNQEGISLLGFRDGYEGIAFDRTMRLTANAFSGILTVGGTILRTSRNKPNKMPVGKNIIDMTDAIVENYNKHQLECLVCIGGGGTHKSALRLKKKGLNIITLPKTIDNDLAVTDTTIGFDTATGTATSAIDSLHSTASSHKRIMLVEVMGHRAGWLTLASGIAGGADVALLPEIPYDLNKVADAIKKRTRQGKVFSIVPVAEGAYPIEAAKLFNAAIERKENFKSKKEKNESKEELNRLSSKYCGHTIELAQSLEDMTGLETRVTILGHLQRGGTPSSADRLLATMLGAACAECILKEKYGVMIAAKGQHTIPVPLEDVAGIRKTVPLDHPWLLNARKMGISLGD
ncbi:MAG: 6-phosphofructokinase [Lentisphaerae bacterium]|nr:6-phosphofructokinase [Lentisphaerota bacterium]MCP4103414.1 6-phosphofructokinase [Lentisphaerota bacterium]